MWLEHLLFGACPKARRSFGECVRGSIFRSVFFAYYGAHRPQPVLRPLNFRIFSEVKEGDRRKPQQPFGCEDLRRETDAEIGEKTKFYDNTERKDQRGKEKQKESLYNLEFRSFFELEI